ncbi:MAG: glycerol kinase GlpK, partial [Nitrospinota bacterium]
MSYLLAMDQGTTSSRSILFDIEGRPVSAAQKELEQHFPSPGWVEHDPEDIWRSQVETAKEVLAKAGVEAGEVAAIGVANQRETTLVWERATGAPLHMAIVWQDRRTTELIDRLKREGLENSFRDKTGLVLDPYFSGSKMQWLMDNIPSIKERAARGEICFGTVDSWLIYRLTGGRVHATDVTNASRTLLFNIHTMEWDDELLDIFKIPKNSLPKVLPSTGWFGNTDPQLFGGAIPIAGVAGDQQAALFGQACFSPGMVKNTYGTGAFVMMNTGEKHFLGDGALTTLAWQLKGQKPVYALEGSIFIAGAAIQWLRDGLGLIESASEVEELARKVDDTGGIYFVPALTGLGAPHWDPYARGLIIGITRGSTRAHLIRAALEAMA